VILPLLPFPLLVPSCSSLPPSSSLVPSMGELRDRGGRRQRAPVERGYRGDGMPPSPLLAPSCSFLLLPSSVLLPRSLSPLLFLSIPPFLRSPPLLPRLFSLPTSNMCSDDFQELRKIKKLGEKQFQPTAQVYSLLDLSSEENYFVNG
jgi:hypothetical protein